jgi:hypothetical protein
MAPYQPPRQPGEENERTGETGPKSSPQTDPTSSSTQEKVGEWTANERAAVRKNDEPGLTDRDREARV